MTEGNIERKKDKKKERQKERKKESEGKISKGVKTEDIKEG
jgi:hypothetical protein